MSKLFALLQGYKTYIVGVVAILAAGTGFWNHDLTLAAAAQIILTALVGMGLRSSVATTLVQLLQVLGVQLPPNPTQAAVKKAVAAAAPMARKVVPVLFVCAMAGAVLSMAACSFFPAQDPKTILEEVQYGEAIAKATYTGICLIPNAPSFCTDPGAMSDYNKAISALDAVIATTAAAIATAGDVNSDTISALLATLQNDWAVYNQIVNTMQARNAALKGLKYTPIPLH